MAFNLKAFGSSDITDDENSDRRTRALKLCDFLSFPPSVLLPLLLFFIYAFIRKEHAYDGRAYISFV